MNYKNIYRTVQVCSSEIQSLHFFSKYTKERAVNLQVFDLTADADISTF